MSSERWCRFYALRRSEPTPGASARPWKVAGAEIAPCPPTPGLRVGSGMNAASRARLLCALLPMLAMVDAFAADAVPALRLGVVGDSDSHAYHDSLHFDGSRGHRGGEYHASTLQWTEALQRLRGRWIDQGAWARHGLPGGVGVLAAWLDLPARAPAKEDFEYNFAVSGARCESLMGGERQLPQLVRLMDEAPAQWRGGVVLVRIGVNSFGQRDSLERLAHDPRDRALSDEIDACIGAVRGAVAYLHRHHPATRVVLVGIFDNSNIGDDAATDRPPRALANIAAALDRYDDALRAMAAADARIAFFDDRAWFAGLWGGRTPAGAPAYRDLPIGGRFRVANSQGDAPVNAVLADGHAGTAWNALWASALVDLLNRRFDAGIPPVEESEVLPLLRTR